MRERFEFLESQKRAWGSLYNIGDLPIDVLALCKKLEMLPIDGKDSDLDGSVLCEELKQSSLMIASDRIQPRKDLQYLKDIRTVDLCPNLWLALRMLLTLPVSVWTSPK